MNWSESIGFFKTMEACGSFVTSTPARLPEKGLSFKRGLYVRTAVPFRMMALVSWQEESSTTTNSVPKTKQRVLVCKIKKTYSVNYSTCSHKNHFYSLWYDSHNLPVPGWTLCHRTTNIKERFVLWPVTLTLTSRQWSWVTATVDLLVTTPLFTVLGMTVSVELNAPVADSGLVWLGW